MEAGNPDTGWTCDYKVSSPSVWCRWSCRFFLYSSMNWLIIQWILACKRNSIQDESWACFAFTVLDLSSKRANPCVIILFNCLPRCVEDSSLFPWYRSTRFRWYQSLMPSMQSSKQHWAVDDVYIGAACRDLCHGHGRCDYPRCVCDEGYGGPTCVQTVPLKVVASREETGWQKKYG